MADFSVRFLRNWFLTRTLDRWHWWHHENTVDCSNFLHCQGRRYTFVPFSTSFAVDSTALGSSCNSWVCYTTLLCHAYGKHRYFTSTLVNCEDSEPDFFRTFLRHSRSWHKWQTNVHFFSNAFCYRETCSKCCFGNLDSDSFSSATLSCVGNELSTKNSYAGCSFCLRYT